MAPHLSARPGVLILGSAARGRGEGHRRVAEMLKSGGTPRQRSRRPLAAGEGTDALLPARPCGHRAPRCGSPGPALRARGHGLRIEPNHACHASGRRRWGCAARRAVHWSAGRPDARGCARRGAPGARGLLGAGGQPSDPPTVAVNATLAPGERSREKLAPLCGELDMRYLRPGTRPGSTGCRRFRPPVPAAQSRAVRRRRVRTRGRCGSRS